MSNRISRGCVNPETDFPVNSLFPDACRRPKPRLAPKNGNPTGIGGYFHVKTRQEIPVFSLDIREIAEQGSQQTRSTAKFSIKTISYDDSEHLKASMARN